MKQGAKHPESNVSVLVACYNEASTLERAITEVTDALMSVRGSHEVVIVDDGSTDGSGRIADELARSSNLVRVVHHDVNRGLGGFYRTAFREATRDVLYFMAADLQPIPSEYFPIFIPLLDENVLVVGFDERREAPLMSKAFSWGEKQLFAFLFPGVPKIGGPLMIRRDLLRRLPLVLSADDGDRGWTVLWELIIRARRAGLPMARVPVRRHPRAKGRTRGSTVRTAATMLSRLGRLRQSFRV